MDILYVFSACMDMVPPPTKQSIIPSSWMTQDHLHLGSNQSPVLLERFIVKLDKGPLLQQFKYI